MLTPISTGRTSRPCRVCTTPFVGLGTLCPVHLAQHSRRHAAEIQTAREQSRQILEARESANRRPRREFPDELDMIEVAT